MSFLVVGSVTVQVAADSQPSRSYEEVGDRARAFDGTMRQTVRARKRTWRVRTLPLTRTDADTLVTALTTTSLPISCSGDLLGGSVNCYATVDAWQTMASAGSYRVVTEFTLMEA